MLQWLANWRLRHQHPTSFVLHWVAIPMLISAGCLAVWQLCRGEWSLWYRPVILIAVSYLLQWIGHRIEGNDMGEVILVKRFLKKPYVAVSPRYHV